MPGNSSIINISGYNEHEIIFLASFVEKCDDWLKIPYMMMKWMLNE